jgi:DNA-directed RNA polymerase specialized sigma24 family protein
MEPEPQPEGVLDVDGLLSVPVPPLAPDADAGSRPAEVPIDRVALGFADFYEDGRDRVVRALALTLGDVHLAAEATDEAMARAYERWDRVSGFDNPGGWVYRVGLNWATSVLSRRRRGPRPVFERNPTDIGPVPEPDIRVALGELDVRQRAVVVCRFYLGLSEAETAAALDTRPGTVKSRLHRAIRQLQARLAHLDPGDPR